MILGFDPGAGVAPWIIGPLVVATLVALCGYGIAALRENIKTSKAVRTYVVPHFQPQTAQQIMDGGPDRTLPTRIGDLEDKVDGHAARIARLEKAKGHLNGGLGA